MTNVEQQFQVLKAEEMMDVYGGKNGVRNLIYGISGGAAGGAALGGAICSPLGPVAVGCAILGGLYGVAAGGLAAGLDTHYSRP